jgi:hypothetical protein
MDIQIAALCDFAADYGGRLCVSGVFENIMVVGFPAIHLQCAVVLRVVFRREDEGLHHVVLNFVDEDGKPIMPPLDTQMPLEMPPDWFFGARNFILNMQNLKFDRPGMYAVDVRIDERNVISIPLTVRQVEWNPPRPEK